MILILSFFLVYICTFVNESYTSYRNEIKKAQTDASNISHLLEEQISYSFKKIDLVLQEIQNQMQDEGKLTAQSFEKYGPWFKRRKDNLPEVLSFKAVDENGYYLADDAIKLGKANLSDRDYFQYLKSLKRDELVISPPIISKTNKVWVVVLARPIIIKNEFKGMVFGTIPLTHFKEIFSKLNVGKKGVITLYGLKQELYARTPWLADKIGTKVNVHKYYHQVTQKKLPFINYTIHSQIDGVERITTMRKISHYPLIVLVGISTDEVLAGWKNRIVIYSVMLVAVTIFAAIFFINFLLSLEKIEDQRKQVIQAAKLSSLGEMAGGIAHEINNPLTIISASVTALRRSLREKSMLSEQDQKLMLNIERIAKTTDRIAKIVNGLKNFSRDTTHDPLIKKSLKEIIHSTLDLCQEKLKTLMIDVIIDEFEDIELECHHVQIEQVLMNLISNAVDALQNSAVRIIKISTTMENGHVFLQVRDTGTGVPKAISDKIMQPFFTTKEIGKGTGLGLSISKGIIESHQGKFYLDGDSDETCFVIELPICRRAA